MERVKLVQKNKMQYLENLKSDLQKYDKIFLVLGEEKTVLPFLTAFCSVILAESKEKVLVLSVFHMENEEEYLAIFRKITGKDALNLSRLYRMYEFSDRFFILSPDKTFGGIFNFLETGLLDRGEVFRALLYGKING